MSSDVSVLDTENIDVLNPRVDLSGTFDDDMTIEEARDILNKRLDRGDYCPCCTQRAQVYDRPINSTMARALMELYYADGESVYIHTPSLRGDTHEMSQFRYWDMIEAPPGDENKREDGGKAGYWRLTPRGVAFAQNRRTVPKYACVYDGERVEYAGPRVNIDQCLGKKFNFRELMEGRVIRRHKKWKETE